MKKDFSVGNERQNTYAYWCRIPLRKNKSHLSLKNPTIMFVKNVVDGDSWRQLVERQVAKRKN